MTKPEIDADGLAKALTDFIANVRQQDPDWEDDFDDGEITLVAPSGDYFAPELPLQAAITAYLAATRTSEAAEPVAWMYTETRSPSGREVRRVRLSEHRQAVSDEDVNEFGLIETPLYAAPHPSPARDDQVEAVTDEMVGRAAVAVMKEDGCGYTINGLHVLCDDNLADGLVDGYGKALKQERCDCRVMARAALLAAMGSTKP